VFAHGKAVQNDIKYALGAALLIAVIGLVVRSLTAPPQPVVPAATFPSVRIVPTVAVGILGGFIVGMTSVGSGSLMIVALMFLYPLLTGSQLVGTDLVQSVPLVCSAALGQLIFGDVQLALTVSLLIGALPAVYLGARLSSVAPSGFLRVAIGIMLLLSGLKLLEVSNMVLAVVAIAAVAASITTIMYRRNRAASGSPIPTLAGESGT
jgi:uncharacterized protein